MKYLSHRTNYLVKKGEQIIKEGDPVTGVYFVYSGTLKVHKRWGEKDIIWPLFNYRRHLWASMNELLQERLISLAGKKIQISNPPGLKQLTQEES